MKKFFDLLCIAQRRWEKTIRIMKLTIGLFLFAIISASAVNSYSQTARISLNLKNATIVDIFREIERSSEFGFFFKSEELNLEKRQSIDMANVTIDEVLTKVLGGNYSYKILDRNIVVTKGMLDATQQQGKKVSGRVTDQTGASLPGASVVIKGTTNGVITDNGGNFSLNNVAENGILQFSFVGMKSVQVSVAGKNTVNVTMLTESVDLDEVVAIAYGTIRRKDLTGSISTVDSKLISTQANSTVTRALEGAVAGLQVSSVDGQPGLDMGIRIRGLGTASQNNANALVVVDGVPAQNDNPLATINPKDIESITVLKDAASTALYGSRGANGVVLVTTKKGAQGKTKIAFEGRWGVNQIGPYKFDKLDNPQDVYEYDWQAIYNSYRYGVGGTGVSKNYSTNVQTPNHTDAEAGQFASAHLFNYTGSETNFSRNALGNWMLYNVPGALYTTTGTGATASATMSGAYLVNPDGKLNSSAKLLYNDNYDKFLLEDKLRQEYNVSASGGTDKMDYFASLGYLEDPSYIRGSKFARYSGRANVNAQLYDWLKVGSNIGYSNRITQSPATRYGRNPGSSQANVFRLINGQNPLIQLYAHDQNGNVIKNADGGNKVHVLAGDTWSPLGLTSTSYGSQNPLTMLDEDQDIKNASDLTTRTYAEAKITKDLKFTTNLNYEKYTEIRTRYWQSATGQAQGVGAFGKIYQDVTVLNTQELLNYTHDFGKHHVDALGGHEFNKYKLQNLSYNSAYELIPGFVSFANFVGHYTGGTFSTPGGTDALTAMESYFGRAHYIYDDKYYAEASLRRDGSSKFKYASTRWGNFWSVGGGWRITSESFMANTKNWLDLI